MKLRSIDISHARQRSSELVSALTYSKCSTQITPHPPEPNAEKLAYFAEASRMSTERSFVRLQANYGFVKKSDFETRRNAPI
jgi:hypothetical protein